MNTGTKLLVASSNWILSEEDAWFHLSTDFVQQLLKLKNKEALKVRTLRKPADKVQPEPLLPIQPIKVQRGTLSAALSIT